MKDQMVTEGFEPDDPRINVADLDSPEKIAAAAKVLRKSLRIPEPLTLDTEPYAIFYYRRKPQIAAWNRDRMNRDLIRAGKKDSVPVSIRMDMATRMDMSAIL